MRLMREPVTEYFSIFSGCLSPSAEEGVAVFVISFCAFRTPAPSPKTNDKRKAVMAFDVSLFIVSVLCVVVLRPVVVGPCRFLTRKLCHKVVTLRKREFPSGRSGKTPEEC